MMLPRKTVQKKRKRPRRLTLKDIDRRRQKRVIEPEEQCIDGKQDSHHKKRVRGEEITTSLKNKKHQDDSLSPPPPLKKLRKTEKKNTETSKKRVKKEPTTPESESKNNNSTWDDRYQELIAFKEENGTTNVPSTSNNKKLHNWVRYIRTEYNLYQSGDHSYITKEKIQALEDIDFVWSDRLCNWDLKFQELENYYKVNGHVNVPTSESGLGQWVGNQRRNYKLFQKSKRTNRMTQEKIDRLESLGFIWNVLEADWHFRYDQLKVFKTCQGHVNVPIKTSGKLGLWVHRQRTQYRLLKQNEKSNLTPERIQLLDSIGFVWKVRK